MIDKNVRRGAATGSRGVSAFFSSVRVRLILLVLLVFAPAFGLLVYMAALDRQSAMSNVRAKVLHLARLAAAEDAQIVQSTHHLLQYLARTPEVRGLTRRSACNDMLAQQIKLYPYYDNLGVAGSDGIRFCSVLAPEQSPDLSDRSYFRRALETRDFSVGDYQIGRSSGNSGVGFGYPVLDSNGGVRGVVYVTLNLAWLGQSLVRTQLPPDATLSVVDGTGIILVHFPDTEEQVGGSVPPAILQEMISRSGEGTVEGAGPSGVRRIWGFVPLKTSSAGTLYVRVSLPAASAYANIEYEFYRNLILIAATALIVIAIVWAGGERLVMRPVKALTLTSRRLGRGEYRARTGEPHVPGEFGELARAFDNMAAALQERDLGLKHAMRDLHAQAITDALTGLYNRRYLYELLPRELLRAKRKGTPVSIIMLDIDYFKNVNDTLGHEAGDYVLREFGALIKKNIRDIDIACRYGGEEFCLVLPEAPLDIAQRKAEEIRIALEQRDLNYRGKPITITASLGVAVYPDHGTETDILLRAADEALYEAKGSGRNQVVVRAAGSVTSSVTAG